MKATWRRRALKATRRRPLRTTWRRALKATWRRRTLKVTWRRPLKATWRGSLKAFGRRTTCKRWRGSLEAPLRGWLHLAGRRSLEARRTRSRRQPTAHTCIARWWSPPGKVLFFAGFLFVISAFAPYPGDESNCRSCYRQRERNPIPKCRPRTGRAERSATRCSPSSLDALVGIRHGRQGSAAERREGKGTAAASAS